ncbi:hypothetical protein NEHOM01_1923 [Nematocida homosporus]|uniref:uncharacterized protein n=1 Tax=Nematocida homosporus TaxID=1912981 RepID=UPI002220F2ED|nr:uncharacterized protein NEHOM01_1923 [Nematocida homosporus]KAI5187090.1 hypothetical protein NEHOM01_1923 [Nematocida homosporus]
MQDKNPLTILLLLLAYILGAEPQKTIMLNHSDSKPRYNSTDDTITPAMARQLDPSEYESMHFKLCEQLSQIFTFHPIDRANPTTNHVASIELSPSHLIRYDPKEPLSLGIRFIEESKFRLDVLLDASKMLFVDCLNQYARVLDNIHTIEVDAVRICGVASNPIAFYGLLQQLLYSVDTPQIYIEYTLKVSPMSDITIPALITTPLRESIPRQYQPKIMLVSVPTAVCLVINCVYSYYAVLSELVIVGSDWPKTPEVRTCIQWAEDYKLDIVYEKWQPGFSDILSNEVPCAHLGLYQLDSAANRSHHHSRGDWQSLKIDADILAVLLERNTIRSLSIDYAILATMRMLMPLEAAEMTQATLQVVHVGYDHEKIIHTIIDDVLKSSNYLPIDPISAKDNLYLKLITPWISTTATRNVIIQSTLTDYVKIQPGSAQLNENTDITDEEFDPITNVELDKLKIKIQEHTRFISSIQPETSTSFAIVGLGNLRPDIELFFFFNSISAISCYSRSYTSTRLSTNPILKHNQIWMDLAITTNLDANPKSASNLQAQAAQALKILTPATTSTPYPIRNVTLTDTLIIDNNPLLHVGILLTHLNDDTNVIFNTAMSQTEEKEVRERIDRSIIGQIKSLAKDRRTDFRTGAKYIYFDRCLKELVDFILEYVLFRNRQTIIYLKPRVGDDSFDTIQKHVQHSQYYSPHSPCYPSIYLYAPSYGLGPSVGNIINFFYNGKPIYDSTQSKSKIVRLSLWTDVPPDQTCSVQAWAHTMASITCILPSHYKNSEAIRHLQTLHDLMLPPIVCVDFNNDIQKLKENLDILTQACQYPTTTQKQYALDMSAQATPRVVKFINIPMPTPPNTFEDPAPAVYPLMKSCKNTKLPIAETLNALRPILLWAKVYFPCFKYCSLEIPNFDSPHGSIDQRDVRHRFQPECLVITYAGHPINVASCLVNLETKSRSPDSNIIDAHVSIRIYNERPIGPYEFSPRLYRSPPVFYAITTEIYQYIQKHNSSYFKKANRSVPEHERSLESCNEKMQSCFNKIVLSNATCNICGGLLSEIFSEAGLKDNNICALFINSIQVVCFACIFRFHGSKVHIADMIQSGFSEKFYTLYVDQNSTNNTVRANEDSLMSLRLLVYKDLPPANKAQIMSIDFNSLAWEYNCPPSKQIQLSDVPFTPLPDAVKTPLTDPRVLIAIGALLCAIIAVITVFI